MSELISFAVLWFFLAIPLGPNALISMDASLRYGWPRALFVPLGITGAAIIYSVMSLTALAYVLRVAPQLFDFVIVVGSLYLLYLGYRILVRPALGDADAPQALNSNRLFWLGFATSLSNPKAALVYLSVLPSLAQSNTIKPLAIIITVCAIALAVYSAYSGFANLFRRFIIGYPYRQKFMDVLACLSFAFIAIRNLYFIVG